MSANAIQRIRVVDSHTGGEPTRVVLEGGPDLGSGPLDRRLALLRERHDTFRSAVVNEPRGSDVLVGALLCEPADPSCSAGVIFFNNVGYLGMCGHGTIGLVVTLAHLGRLQPGAHRIETPVGVVEATLLPDGSVSVRNVASWRAHKGVKVTVPGHGEVTGDVAWGGNWFYLVEDHGHRLTLPCVAELTDLSTRIRQAVNAGGHPEVDHVELIGPGAPGSDARNFVLCPGLAYDRSPCGTGTSAKLACLAADGKLQPSEQWVQESILGTRFVGRFEWDGNTADSGKIIPTVTGTAHVTAEATLLVDARDPFCWGIRLD
ncbi:MAG: proline racemase family protein [Gemmataceae bacterium]|nr:proline racemase family protein [Gemmataceae bacterium]